MQTLIQQVWIGVQDPAFLTSSQMMPGPHVQKQELKGCFWSNPNGPCLLQLEVRLFQEAVPWAGLRC